jgi:hypothetical protein
MMKHCHLSLCCSDSNRVLVGFIYNYEMIAYYITSDSCPCQVYVIQPFVKTFARVSEYVYIDDCLVLCRLFPSGYFAFLI